MESTDGELITFDGKMWFKRIPKEEAFRIRFDVPLFWKKRGGYIEADVCCIENYRNGSHAHIGHMWWSEYLWFIEVDPPDKEEYIPVE